MHYLRERAPGHAGTTWCGKFLLLLSARGRWTETYCQVSCAGCIAEKHADMRAKGQRPMRDPM